MGTRRHENYDSRKTGESAAGASKSQTYSTHTYVLLKAAKVSRFVDADFTESKPLQSSTPPRRPLDEALASANIPRECDRRQQGKLEAGLTFLNLAYLLPSIPSILLSRLVWTFAGVSDTS
ncbi:hypothetical protein CPC08DRAFT_761528 [Agrocybe pediades]|nr:hypothetical protein CPC08DRAFT_761528 [Agrocybe pediades]